MIPDKRTYSVSEITAILRNVVESEPRFKDCWIEGEISGLARPRSGHIYFSLKDDKCQIKCVIFRQAARRLKFPPKDGDAVLLHGKLGIYDLYSQYQLIGDRMDPIGVGALQLAFERLKEQLAGEGLFDDEYKKPLSAFPRKIGVVTSKTGAVLQDILRMLSKRYPLVEVVLCPTLVQGDEAAPMIAGAIERLNRFSDIDLLIVGRGGGSIEDLWAFNEEMVARAIFASEIPIVSAVGHETDVTISDLVADVRAPTPSAAVELIVPDQGDLRRHIGNSAIRLLRGIGAYINSARTELSNLDKRIVPDQRIDAINRFYQRIDELDIQNQRAMAQVQNELRWRYNGLAHGRAKNIERFIFAVRLRLSSIEARVVANRRIDVINQLSRRVDDLEIRTQRAIRQVLREMERLPADLDTRKTRSIKGWIANARLRLSGMDDRVVFSHQIMLIDWRAIQVDDLGKSVNQGFTHRLDILQAQLGSTAARVEELTTRRVNECLEQLSISAAKLTALSPVATLGTGLQHLPAPKR